MADDKVSRRDLLMFWRRKPEPEIKHDTPPPPKRVAPPVIEEEDDDDDPIFETPTMDAPVTRARAVPGDRLLRPPGALAEPEFLAACTRCGKCVDACGTSAIFLLPEPFGALAGTPAIAPRRFPCWITPGVPCITACPTGALAPVKRIHLGVAVLDEATCLPHHGTPCDRCVSVCPVSGALVVEEGRPAVVADVCTGCGVCEHVCPTDPASIQVRPDRLIG